MPAPSLLLTLATSTLSRVLRGWPGGETTTILIPERIAASPRRWSGGATRDRTDGYRSLDEGPAIGPGIQFVERQGPFVTVTETCAGCSTASTRRWVAPGEDVILPPITAAHHPSG
jgi:hypothetical protein